MIWTDKDIVEWHKKTFPDTDLKSQLLKLEEELLEMEEATKKTDQEAIMNEVADVYIVSVVLAKRYHSRIGISYLRYFCFTNIQILEHVSKKMDENVKRTWEKKNGVDRHKKVLTHTKKEV